MRYFLIFLSLVLSISIFAKIYIVPDTYQTIQSAIDNASNGDTLLVKPGIYKEKITLKNKSLFITSKFFLAHNKSYLTNTILNGEGKYTPISFENCPEGTVFSGFSIINGYAKIGGGLSIKNSNLILDNLNIIQNTAEVKGGGIYLLNSTVDLIDIKIAKNSSIGIVAGGGGILSEDSHINAYNIKITDNIAFLGGGFYALNSDLKLKNVTIKKNNAESKAGGIYLINCKNSLLKNVNILENSAFKEGGIGGGITFDGSSPIVINSKISDNIAYKGAGIYLTFSDAKFINCLIDNNKAKDFAGAMLLYHSNPKLENVTIVQNKAKTTGGIACKSMTNLTVMNSIFWNNEDSDISTDYTSKYNLSYTMIKGNFSGMFVYDKEPIFKDYKNRDYHLNKTSFGINKGNPQKKYNDKNGSRNDLGCYGGKFGNW